LRHTVFIYSERCFRKVSNQSTLLVYDGGMQHYLLNFFLEYESGAVVDGRLVLTLRSWCCTRPAALSCGSGSSRMCYPGCARRSRNCVGRRLSVNAEHPKSKE